MSLSSDQLSSFTRRESKVIKWLQSRKVLTLEELMAHAEVSHVTVFAALRKWGYHRSLNRNGRYYALKDTPRFGKRGLWNWGEACFSIHSSLPATLQAWVYQSPGGLTAPRLGSELGASVQSSLRALSEQGVVFRERLGRQFVYFSGEPEVRRGQRARYLATWGRPREKDQPEELPSKDTIIEILLQLIEHPKLSAENVRQRLRRAGDPASLKEVRAVFAYYEVDKKRAL